MGAGQAPDYGWVRVSGIREDLIRAYKNAWTLQNREKHGSSGDLEYIGETETADGWIYRYYHCPDDDTYWVDIYIRRADGIISLHESVHGKKRRYTA